MLPSDYTPHSAPFPHQQEQFLRTATTRAWGSFWEQGCGKTKPVIDKAAFLYEAQEIDTLFVVAPNGVHLNWIKDELPAHFPDRLRPQTRVFCWNGSKKGTKKHAAEAAQVIKHDGFLIVTMSYDAFMTKEGKNYAWKVLSKRKAFYVLDESDNVKTPGAKRTQSVVASGKHAFYRGILTGTPVTQGPFDVYSQIRFLDADFWKRELDIHTFTEFKAFFGVWRFNPVAFEKLRQKGNAPADFNPMYEYRNLDILYEKLRLISDRLTKEEAGLNLPPKLYSKRWFELDRTQRKAYDTLQSELELELASGLVVDGSLAMVRLLRLQQISCGYVPTNGEREEPYELIGDTNPRLDTAVDYLNGLGHQAIVWCRFRKDIELLHDALGKKNAALYYGGLKDDECELSKRAFKAGEKQFIVASEKMQAGHTLTEAKTCYFYSNSFKLKTRLQMEDRAHRIGQDKAVHIVDSVGFNTVDLKIVDRLRGKFDIASKINGDELREWI